MGPPRFITTALLPHPTTGPTGIERLMVDPNIGGDFGITYLVHCPQDLLRIPRAAPPARTDELWKHTCFELFIKPESGTAYFEFNFSPSGQWAAYEFADYRTGMKPLDIPSPDLLFKPLSNVGFALWVTCPFRAILGEWLAGACKIGLSAVIETNEGEKSYWALAHPADKPDFHHPDSFTLDLPAP